MHATARFETPENVQVSYTLAGLGSRFIAWFLDQILVSLAIFAVFILLLITGITFDEVFDQLRQDGEFDPEEAESAILVIIGLIFLCAGLGSFAYFTLCELLWRGQTPGKRALGIRVVKLDGFGLDPASIFVRNIVRVLDNIPLMWIVPLMSKRSQRAGDLLAGTIVISEDKLVLGSVRNELSERKPVDAEFRFDGRTLAKLSESDFDGIERLLDRWNSLPSEQQEMMLGRFIPPIVLKLGLNPPANDRRLRFLEDLLAAELWNRNRLLS